MRAIDSMKQGLARDLLAWGYPEVFWSEAWKKDRARPPLGRSEVGSVGGKLDLFQKV